MLSFVRTILLFLIFIQVPILIKASDYYWVGGDGDWTNINHWATISGGNVKHIQSPTPADNVIFDNNSFQTSTLTINLNIPSIQFKNFDLSAVNNPITFIGNCQALNSYGHVYLSSLVSINIIGSIDFEANSYGNNIYTNGYVFTGLDLVFKGSGSWNLKDSLRSAKSIQLEHGTLNVQSDYVNIGDFYSNSNLNRSLNLNSAKFYTKNWYASGPNFLLNSGNSKVFIEKYLLHYSTGNCNFYDAEFSKYAIVENSTASFSFHDLEFLDSAFVFSNCTYNILKLNKPREYKFKAGTTQTILSDLISQGICSSMIKIYSDSGFSTFSKNSGAISVDYNCLKNIHASGGASFISTNTLDSGNNTGWIIQQMPTRNLYWVGGSGQWDDSLHWSLTNGGIGGECAPQLVDNVFFTNLSFSNIGDIVFINSQNAKCHNINWNTNKYPVFKSISIAKLFISGSLSFCKEMILQLSGEIKFVADQPNQTITSAVLPISAPIRFSGLGSWILQDSLIVMNDIVLDTGTINTNNQYILSKGFYSKSANPRGLILGSSLWDIQSAEFIVNQQAFNLNAGTSTIRFVQFGGSLLTSYSPAVTFYNVVFNDTNKRGTLESNYSHFHKVTFIGDGEISKFSTFDSLVFSRGKDYIFDGEDTIISALVANGSCTRLITIRNKKPFDEVKLHKLSGNFIVSSCHIRGIISKTPIVSSALNSGDLGDNTGWNFTNSISTLYWINGTGYWNDSSHWALSSGGISSGCVPTISTDVVFDHNSFVNISDTVYFDKTNIFHRNMTWTNSISKNPVFYNTNDKNIEFVSGNIEFISSMEVKQKGNTHFIGNYSSKTIKMSSQTFDSKVVFADSCVWTLLDTLTVKDTIEFYKGSISLAGNCLQANDFHAKSNHWKVFDLTNSRLNLKSYCSPTSKFIWIQNNLTNLISAGSEINLLNQKSFVLGEGANSVNFYNLTFDGNGDGFIQPAFNQILNYNKLSLLSDVEISGENHSDTLFMRKGHIYVFESNKHQYINNLWTADADCYSEISIRSSTSNQAHIHRTNGNTQLNFVNICGLNAIGTNSFIANNSNDLGGNTNWNINASSGKQLFWVNGNGNWDDTAHWSYSSGGPAGACIPTFRDDVFFDLNSFTANNQIVHVYNYSECKNMDWTGAAFQPTFNVIGQNPYLHIFGSVKLTQQMNTDVFQMCFVSGNSGNTITTFGHDIKRTYFAGYGSWLVIDTLRCSEVIDFYKGTLNFGNSYVETNILKSMDNKLRVLDLGASNSTIYEKVDLNADSLTVNPGSSQLVFLPKFAYANHIFKLTGSKNLNFYNIEFPQSRKGNSLMDFSGGGKHHFNKVYFGNDGSIFGENSFDSLFFSSGNTYKLEKNKTQTINNYWYIRGTNCYSINLESTSKNDYANVLKSSGIVSGDFINMRDIHANGGASFFAGAFSTDISNNTGWSFTNGPQYVYGLGKDTSFPIGGSVLISTANFNGGNKASYHWSNGSTSQNISVNQIGSYIVTVTFDAGCSIVDTIFVGCTVKPQFSILGNHCFGDSSGSITALIPSSQYTYFYNWSSGDTTASISNKKSGSYILNILVDTLCSSTDTVFLPQPSEVISPFKDTSFCETDSLLLDPGNNFQSVWWWDMYPNKARWVSQPGSFYLKVQDSAGCWSVIDTVNITKDTKISMSLGADTFLCYRQNLVLKPDKIFQNYLWNDLSTANELPILKTGTFWLMVNNGACKAFDTITILECKAQLKMPNVFTPNGDNYNDVFAPYEYQNIAEFSMQIFNRWGDLVFETNDIEMGWDGKIKNSKADEGVYFWTIHYIEYAESGNSITKFGQGAVTIFY